MDACGVASSSSSSSSNPKPPHVLAVDDSIVDRKIVENLLKNSACKGTFNYSWHEKSKFFPSHFLTVTNCINWFGSDNSREWDAGTGVSGLSWWTRTTK